MQLLIVRHAIAEERDTWAPRDDDLRPLTEDGKKKMKEAAKGLLALIPRVDVLASSPLTRAMQTATILAKVYDKPEPLKVEALVPGQPPAAFAPWLRGHAGRKTVAVVGHEPSLGTLISWLAAGIEQSFVELGKGGACLLELGDKIDAGEAMVEWILRPSHLRTLG
jgi:phosphohistidine phosphatase